MVASGVYVGPPQFSNDNRIINGDMRINQRGVGSGTAVGYTADRWQYAAVSTKGTWSAAVPGSAPGFPFNSGFQSSSAYASAAGDWFEFYQLIEADMVSDFQWGTASAQPVTLSFWAYSSLTGAFSGCIKNAANNRSYPFTYSLPAANTWTRCVVTIPGDTTGTWVMSGNAASINLQFDLGSGTSQRAPAGAWTAGNFIGATGAVSLVAINAATFYVTGVKLEIGTVATPFNRQSLAKSMADCQRYYQVATVSGRFPASAANQKLDVTVSYSTMRAAPTVVLLVAGTIGNVSSSSILDQSATQARFELNSTAAGDTYNLTSTYSLAAEL